MKGDPEQRAIQLGEYIAAHRTTVRAAAAVFGCSKSTVHKDVAVRLRTLPLYSLAVSAGTGQFLDGEDYEMVEVGQEVPEGSNFGVRVAGDSMEPEFHDGQTVWVRQQRSLLTGDIGIFLYGGSAYLKQLVALKDSMALHSLNPAYADIVISPELPLRVLGKVLR